MPLYSITFTLLNYGNYKACFCSVDVHASEDEKLLKIIHVNFRYDCAFLSVVGRDMLIRRTLVYRFYQQELT